jgi:hypothetical protein
VGNCLVLVGSNRLANRAGGQWARRDCRCQETFFHALLALQGVLDADVRQRAVFHSPNKSLESRGLSIVIAAADQDPVTSCGNRKNCR